MVVLYMQRSLPAGKTSLIYSIFFSAKGEKKISRLSNKNTYT